MCSWDLAKTARRRAWPWITLAMGLSYGGDQSRNWPRFNAELSRAVRYEPKRNEAAQKIISMHKRHGEVVTRVLEEKVIEQAAKLVEGTLDTSSLLSLVLGKKH